MQKTDIKMTKCSQKGCNDEGINHCEVCFGVFCDYHSAYKEREKEKYLYEKCFDCYDAYLTENGLY
jgi:hypothetical protein